MPTETARPPRSTSRSSIIAGSLLATAVVIALIIALVSNGEDSGSPEAVSAAGAAHIPTGSLVQTAPVEVSTTLPRLTSVGVDPAVGMTAPTVKASYFSTTEITAKPGDGKGRVFIFLAHWCPHCQAEVQQLVPWFDTNAAPTNVDIVAVSTSVDPGAPNYPPSQWLLRERWPIPTIRDSENSEIASAFGLSGFPFIVVVDDDGLVVSRASGGTTIDQWEQTLASAAG